MNNIIYHTSRPLNDNSSGFQEFDTIDWEIEDSGRKLLKNSLYIEADVEVYSTTNVKLGLEVAIGVNNKVGYHAFFESFSCEAKSQNVQNLQHYPRYVNIVETTSGNIGTIFSPMAQAEGRQCTESGGRYVLQEVKSNGDGTATQPTSPPGMCIKPKIVFNSMVGDDYSFNANGAIRLSTNLARNGTALYGSQLTGLSSYILKNIRLKYVTVPDDGKQGPIMMNSVTSVKQTINSQQANLSVKVPSSAVTGVVVTYISQSNEIGLINDSYRLEQLPNIDSIEYLFSDSQSRYVTYDVTDQDDMLQKGVDALSAAGLKVKSNSYMSAGNEAVIHGLDFQQTIDLSRNKFGINLRSSSSLMGQNPRNVYMHFLTIVKL